MDAGLLAQLNVARGARQAAAVVTHLESGKNRLVLKHDLSAEPLADEIAARMKSGKSGVISADNSEIFVQIHVPPPRLVVIGAVHITQALYPIAKACNFDVTIIDPRTAFATEERFSGVALHADWPQEVLEDVGLDSYTAVAAVTHDPKIDDYPLRKALEAECFYVGALGSRKTHGKRLDRLRDVGMDQSALDRIHAPIGLDIAAASPAEIAVAVMAQIVHALRRGEAA